MTDTREIVVRLQLEYPPLPALSAATVPAGEPLLCKVAEVARLLSVGETTVWELISRRELESVKIGASRLVARTEVEAYVNRLRAEKARDDAA